MAIKNYYVVLGIHRQESEAGIRAAYKGLAKKLHPDRVGEHGTKAFQEIAEAYATLSDPEKRRSHNLLLDQEEDRRKGGKEIHVRPDLEPEPLGWRRVSPVGSYQPARPSFVDLDRRGLRNFVELGVPGTEREERLDFDVVLSTPEARRGGVISLDIPISSPCLACGGSGRDWMFPCFDCRGLGLIETLRAVNIRFPPQVQSGTVIEVPLPGFGTPYLRLYVVVD
jgi:DnaJ-class molecular chaperone